MCLDPSEMTSATIKSRIADIDEWLAKNPKHGSHGMYLWRRNNLERILREREERGTHDTAGRY